MCHTFSIFFFVVVYMCVPVFFIHSFISCKNFYVPWSMFQNLYMCMCVGFVYIINPGIIKHIHTHFLIIQMSRIYGPLFLYVCVFFHYFQICMTFILGVYSLFKNQNNDDRTIVIVIVSSLIMKKKKKIRYSLCVCLFCILYLL